MILLAGHIREALPAAAMTAMRGLGADASVGIDRCTMVSK
jgi:hypothetical protein